MKENTIQQKIIDLIFEYEKILKERHLVDYRYNVIYAESLFDLFKISNENNILEKIILAINQKKSLDEVNTLLTKLKDDYSKNITNFLAVKRNAKFVVDKMNTWTDEYNKEMDDTYYEYIKDFHPALKTNIDPNELKTFQHLNGLYNDNNYQSFVALIEMVKPMLRKCECDDENINAQLEKNYEKFQNEIPTIIEKLKNDYPLNKKYVFDNDVTMLAEQADLRVELTKLKSKNKELHENLIEIYGEDVKISS